MPRTEQSKAQRAAENRENRDQARPLIANGNWKIDKGEASITLEDPIMAAALQRELGGLLGKVPRLTGQTITIPKRHLESARDTLSRNKGPIVS